MSRPVWARIDLNALHSNLKRVRALAPESCVMAVVKANAYGHGAVDLALSLKDLVDGFAVAGIGEAEELASAGIRKKIFLLSGFHEKSEIDRVSIRGFVPVIHTWEQLDQLEGSTPSREITVWAKFDSGMHRIGFEPCRAGEVLERLQRMPNVKCTGLMSHLACADDRTNPLTAAQIERFSQIISPHEQDRSLANSAGICLWPQSHLDWVRPGIMLYGCTPTLDATESTLGLRPVMSLYSRIISIAQRKKGEPIGYGADWICPEDLRVGVVACGYADGYPRHAPSGTPVWINGRRAAVAGRVSMDMTKLDLRGLDQVGIGDVVEMWGAHVTATEVAAAAGTISYELLSGVAPRVPRILESCVED